ncbi:MAG: sulfate/molybdate ABC transporter ATP-binding protein [Bauldia sp.]|nr:sulfate/molybdate ABC transporter ATP-binding protein [Bauldia sp.]
MAVDVTVENVVKTFGDAAALHGVSLTIRRGELVALLGPSGSGKTTLLRILAGLEFPDSGRVRFGAEDALGLPVQQRHIGFVFQSYALFRTMTVFDNIAFGLAARPLRGRPSRGAIRERVMELLDLVQLSGLEKRYPSQLSGGQRQRVALARALAIDPRILLLDEPFGALDAKIRRDLRRWLREIHDRTGHTTVFVTHDQAEAVELADRIVVINRGRIEQVGSPDAIYDEPASPFVAGFIGESCSLPVRVEAGRILFEDKPVAIATTGEEGPSTLVFRPENVALVGDRGGGIAGRVVAERRHGASRRCDVMVGAAGDRIEIDLPHDRPPPARGEEIVFLPTTWWLFKR